MIKLRMCHVTYWFPLYSIAAMLILAQMFKNNVCTFYHVETLVNCLLQNNNKKPKETKICSHLLHKYVNK